MALRNSTVDVFLSSFNQTQGDRSGPMGRITSIKNGVATHYDPGNGRPRRVVVQQRTAFDSLTLNGHNSSTGATETLDWTNPELLEESGAQLLSIANAIPRVYDGTDWTNYGTERVVSNRLSETVFHTSQRVLVTPDSAWTAGVTCSVWVEIPNPNLPNDVLYVGFKADDGAWVRTPAIIYDPDSEGDGIFTSAKVIADVSELYFWVVYARLVTGDGKFRALLFDLNGVQVDSQDVDRNQVAAVTTAWWDIVQNPGGGCVLAQPEFTTQDTTDGVTYSVFTQTGGSISVVEDDDANVHCRGKLAWLTNDLGDDLLYLAVIGLGEEPSGHLWAYQVDPTDPGTFLHEYDFDVEGAVDTIFDSLIGYAFESDTPDQPSVLVGFTSLHTADSAQTVGPAFDPQLRYSEVWTVDWGDNKTFIRQNDYTCQVSRAFRHDGEYYGVNYYQSGSGNLISSSQYTVDFTAGDYMIGAPEQKVAVVSGVDLTYGSEKTFPNVPSHIINITEAFSNDTITGGDTVTQIVSGNDLFPRGVPIGTLVLRWTFANYTPVDPTLVGGGRLVVASAVGVANADGTWDVLGTDATGGFPNSVYTPLSNTSGTSLVSGTFASGNFQVDSMAYYQIFDLCTAYTETTRSFLVNGSMVVTGNPTSANNGTKTIQRAITSNNPNSGSNFGRIAGIWITRGSEANSTGGFAAVVAPFPVRQWTFSTVNFDDALLIGPHTLVVTEESFTLPGSFPPLVPVPDTPANNTSSGDGYIITDVPDVHRIETDGTAITAQFFTGTLPEVTIRKATDSQEYTFFLQALTVSYDLIGSYIVVASDSFQTVNNATYVIVNIDPDPDNHIVYAKPTDGRTDYRSQLFYPDDQTITILQQTNVQPEFQSAWLMVPLTGSKPVVGRWEYGIAFADWRFEGSSPPNLFPGCVSSPVRNLDAWTIVLPYRAISFTVGQTAVTTTGQVINAAIASNASTVGLKQFALHDEMGLASNVSGEMLLPGPMCGEFTLSGFHENGVNFGFEKPFIVSQQESDSGIGLRVGGTYQYVVVGEVTDEDGDRVFSIVSPPTDVKLNGANNSITLGGRMLQPLDEDGVPVDKHFGVTNYRLLGISIYRTSYQDDVPTTDHHKITLDLTANALTPVSDNNDSGFTFLDDFTWNYLDENLDAAILPAEVVYTDKGYLPRFPAPAQRASVFWKNRSWCIGYDGAVWMSGEKKEGDATWFFPLFRYVLPTVDKPVSLAEMDDYLEVQCEKSLWYIPSATFPDATGRGGTLPAPVQLPFTNGGTGHAATLRAGVAYSSTAGGVWMITRAHENVWLSQSIQDSLGSQEIKDMTVDKRQRLHVTTSSGVIFVYDQVVQEWYRWVVSPASLPNRLATFNGEAVFQDETHVWLSNPASYADNLDGDLSGIPLDLELALQIDGVRSLKAVWEMQLIGTYRGPHHLNAILSYPDDDPDSPTVFPDPADGPFTPDPTAPYLIAINPLIEQASRYGLRVFADFDDIETPGNSFELEVVSVEVGVDSTSGLDKVRDSRRIPGV